MCSDITNYTSEADIRAETRWLAHELNERVKAAQEDQSARIEAMLTKASEAKAVGATLRHSVFRPDRPIIEHPPQSTAGMTQAEPVEMPPRTSADTLSVKETLARERRIGDFEVAVPLFDARCKWQRKNAETRATYFDTNPYPKTPHFWEKDGALNKKLLGRINELERAWEAQGIKWQIGTEIEYRLDDIFDGRIPTIVQRACTADRMVVEEPKRRQYDKELLDDKRGNLRLRMMFFYEDMEEAAKKNGWNLLQSTFAERRKFCEKCTVPELAVLELQDVLMGPEYFHQYEHVQGHEYNKPQHYPGRSGVPTEGVWEQLGRTAEGMRKAIDGKTEAPKNQLYDVDYLGLFELRLNHTTPRNAIFYHNMAVGLMREQARQYGLRFEMRPNIQYHFSAHDQEGDSFIRHFPLRPDDQLSNEQIYVRDKIPLLFYPGIIDGVMQGLHDGFALYDHGIAEQMPPIAAAPNSKEVALSLRQERFELRSGDKFPPQPAKQIALVLGSALEGFERANREAEAGFLEMKTKVGSGLSYVGSAAHPRKKDLPELFSAISMGATVVTHEDGSKWLRTSLHRSPSPYQWQIVHMLWQEAYGESGLAALPGSPLYNPARWDELYHIFHEIPLKDVSYELPLAAKNKQWAIDVDHMDTGTLRQTAIEALRDFRCKAVRCYYHDGYDLPSPKQARDNLRHSDFLKKVFGEELLGELARAEKSRGRQR